MECLFCEIVEGKRPCRKIYEDDAVLAFLDINPAAPGHCLVVSKKHFTDIFDIDEPSLQSMMAGVRKVAIIIRDKMNVNDINILQNTGRHAGQIVSHIHFHVIPRTENDGIFIKFPRTMMSQEDLDKISEMLRFEKKKSWNDDVRW